MAGETRSRLRLGQLMFSILLFSFAFGVAMPFVRTVVDPMAEPLPPEVLTYSMMGLVVTIVIRAVVKDARKRVVCSQCGVAFKPTDKDKETPICEACREAQLSTADHQAARRRGYGTLVAVVVIGSALVAGLSSNANKASFLLNFLITVLGLPVGLFILLVVWVIWKNRRMTRRLRSEDGPFALAGEIAGRPSLEIEEPPVQLSSYGADEVATTVPGLVAETVERYRDLIGEPGDEVYRFLCFGKREHYEAYFRKLQFDPGHIDGVSMQASLRLILLAFEPSDHRPWYPDRLVGVTTGFALLDRSHANRLDPWLLQGLAGVLGRVGPSQSEHVRINRRIRAAIEAGRVMEGADYFDLQPKDTLRLFKDWRDPATFAHLTQFQQQSYAFVDYLALSGEVPDGTHRFRRLTAEVKPKVRNALTFREVYGRTPQEMLVEWKRWVMAQPDVEAEEFLRPDDLQILHGQLIPTARDESRLLFDRISAVRTAGLLGSRHAVRPLLRLLRDDVTIPKADIVYALENITGRALGERLSAWNEWVRTHHVPEEPVDL